MTSLIRYINSLGELPPIKTLKELTDDQYLYYSKQKTEEFTSFRRDKGVSRAKYGSKLSLKHRSYLAKCNARGIVFELTAQEFEKLCSGKCVYCEQPATGIDRKNSKRGYTIDNCQSCCGVCNMMKYTMSEDRFIEHCQLIVSVWNYRHQ